MRARSALLTALAGILTVALAGMAVAEKATVVRAGGLVLRLNGGVAPKKLPKQRMAPVTLRASANIARTDGGHPPAVRTVTIDFDKQGAINARGLPVCRPGRLQSRDTGSAKKACPKAIVGRGRTTVEVAFPEQRPFTSTGPLVVFNGGVRKGVTTLFVHAYVNVPAPTAIVTRVRVKKIHKGPFGTRAIATVPKIAGGAGSVRKFSLKIHRTFRRHGKKQSYLVARCGNRRLRARGTIAFRDGTRIVGEVVRGCRRRG